MADAAGLLYRNIQRPFPDVVASAKAAIAEAGATLMGEIDHAAAAVTAGLQLKPTLLLIFGNPAGGTLLMQIRPDVGIDLPLKLLIVDNGDAQIQLVAEDPLWLAQRYGRPDGFATAVERMRKLMDRVLDRTITPSAASAAPIE